jgi:hypothetical protein
MMTAAEWRKRLRIRPEWPPEFDALLRDFEAAEAENERLRGEANRKHYERRHRKRNLQALMRLWRAWDGALDAIHRLEDRCVAAEEERNAYERQLLAVKACDGETAKAVAAEARAQAAEAADMDHQAWWLEEKATRELAEARANTLEARLLDLESQIGNTVAPQERGGEEEGDTDGK